MALDRYVGSFSSATSTGNQAVTGVGFQPKVVLFFTSFSSGATTFAEWGIGVATSSSARWAAFALCDDAAAAANDVRAFESSSCIWNLNSDKSTQQKADLVSMDSDGFTINWSTADASARTIHFLALGGSDLSVKVGTFDLNTSTGNQAVTGVGFQPKALLFVNTIATTTEGTADHAVVTLGAAVSTSERWVNNFIGLDAADPMDEQSAHYVDRCLVNIDNSRAVVASADFVSHDADGFTVNLTTAPAASRRYGYIALGGTARFKAGNFTGLLLTGQQTITGVGFRPEAVLFSGLGNSSAFGSTVDHSRMMVGAADASLRNQTFYSIAVDALSTSDTYRNFSTSKTLIALGTNGTTRELAALAAVHADGFVLDYSTIAGVGLKYEFLAISGASDGTSSTKARVSQGALETLRTNTAVKARVSQGALETLRTNTAVKARVSQGALEILRANGAETPLTSARPSIVVVT